MMTRAQLKKLRVAGAEIGAHTHTHPILELMEDGKGRMRRLRLKVGNELILGGSANVFAYPNGVPSRDCSARHGEMVRSLGFVASAPMNPNLPVPVQTFSICRALLPGTGLQTDLLPAV